MACERVCHVQGPSAFAAASDDNMCLDAVAAFGQAPETALIFIEPPAEHRANVGQHKLWQCLKVREGRREGATAWQDHLVDILLSKECLGTFKHSLKFTTIFYSSEFDCIGPGCGRRLRDRPAENMTKLFAYLETQIVLKFSPIISVGSSFELVRALTVKDEEGMWVRGLDKCCR